MKDKSIDWQKKKSAYYGRGYLGYSKSNQKTSGMKHLIGIKDIIRLACCHMHPGGL